MSSSIATDRISPHYGHDVRDLNDEGAWICLTCEPDYDFDHEERTGQAPEEEATA